MHAATPVPSGGRLTTARLLWFCTVALSVPLLAQNRGTEKLNLTTGKDIWQAGCVGCHGADGKGQPEAVIGFEKPDTFPDFTECGQTTPEDDLAWKSIIVNGGPSRAFSPIMPAFGDALTDEQIDKVIAYLRGFCKEKGWARGELNLPRALVTEKAFPEKEEVLTAAANLRGAPGISHEYVHEQRLSKRNQLEIAVPVDFLRPAPGRWYGGSGDIAAGLKHELFSSLRTGSILSVQGEVVLPTGNKQHDLGTGVTTFGVFAMYDQLLPWHSFLQTQGGADLPHKVTDETPQSVFFRSALGKSFRQNHGLGRMWSPMFEVVADHDLLTGAKTYWDVIPEVQVTLSRRQHIRANIGVRMPASHTAGRQPQLMFYLLWDWQDGKITEGW